MAELLVKDVLPELEQATDIPARIKAVRAQPAQPEPTRFNFQPGTVFTWGSAGATSSTNITYTTTVASTNALSGGWGLQQNTSGMQQQQGLLSQTFSGLSNGFSNLLGGK